MTKSLCGTRGDCGKERLKRWVFGRFLKNSQWRRRRDVLRQCSTAWKRRPEKLDRRWLKDGCIIAVQHGDF